MASPVLALAALLLIPVAASAQAVVMEVVPAGIGTNWGGPMAAWAWTRDAVEAEAAWLRNATSRMGLMGSQDVSRGDNTGFGVFTVMVGVGTPAQQQRMSISMASGLSWFPSSAFRSTASSSLRGLSCADNACWTTAKGEGSIPDACAGSRSAAKPCSFDVTFADGSAAAGNLVLEQVSFGGATRSAVLGMAKDGNQGMLSLGRSPNNVAFLFGGRFSYRPPLYTDSNGAPGSLCLGADCAAPRGAVTSARATPKQSAMFAVDFSGLSVGGFQLPAAADGVTVVESSNFISKLVPQAYDALKKAFLNAVGAGVPRAPAQSILDTCFSVDADSALSGKGGVTFPSVTLHFGRGGDVVLPRAATLAALGPKLVCLGFAVSDFTPPINVIGSFQLQGLTLAVDLNTQTMGFAPNA